MRSLFAPCLWIAVFVMTFAITTPSVWAESSVYKYVDKDGLSHYVDDPSKIPEQYRKDEQKPHDLPGIIKETTRRGSRELAPPPSLPSKAEVAEAIKDLDLSQFSFQEETLQPKKEESAQGQQIEKFQTFLHSKLGKTLLVVAAIITLVQFVSLWVLMSRAQMPAFGLLVPVYNAVLLSRLGGFSGWWLLWIFVPFIGAPLWALTVHYGVAKSFGRGTGFAIGAAILPFIFIPILAFTEPS